MKCINRLFRKLLFFLFLAFVLFINLINTKSYAQSLNEKVVGEGTLVEIRPVQTHEISNPAGFAIQYPAWIISPVGANTTVFLRSNKMSLRDFLNKRIRFEGSYFKIPFKKHSNISFSNPYDEIIIDTIYIIK